AHRKAGELDKAAVDPQRVGAAVEGTRDQRGRVGRVVAGGVRRTGRPLGADVHVRPQSAVLGLRAQIDAHAAADTEAEVRRVGPRLATARLTAAPAAPRLAAV